MGYLLCGPDIWIVDRGPIYTERLFGAATKTTDQTLFLALLRFSKAAIPFVVFIFGLSHGLACFVVFSYPVH